MPATVPDRVGAGRDHYMGKRLNADTFVGWLRETLGKPEGIGRGTVKLIVLESFAAFGDSR